MITELARLVSAVTSFRDFTEGRLRALSPDEWAEHRPRVAAEVRMFETACDQARRVLRDVARLGLEDAAREQAEADYWVARRVGEKTAAIIRRVLTDLADRHLPPDPRDERVAAIVVRRVRQVEPR